MGAFKKNIMISSGHEKTPDEWGTAWWLAFSHDPAQKYMIVADGRNELVHILDHETGKELASFGRCPGHQLGEFTHHCQYSSMWTRRATFTSPKRTGDEEYMKFKMER